MFSPFIRASQPAARLCRVLLAACLATGTAAPVLGQDAIWGQRFGAGYFNPSDTTGLDVTPAPDGSGDFYVCGIVDATNYVFGYDTNNVLVADRESGGYEDAFVARYRSDGVPVWVRFGRGRANDRANALTTLSSGAVIVIGEYDLFQQGIRSGGISFDADWSDIRPDTTPNVYLPPTTGTSSGNFVACYEPDGTLRFARQLTRVLNLAGTPTDIAALPGEEFMIVGSYRHGTTFGDINDPNPVVLPAPPSYGFISSNGFVARYWPNGDIRWVEIVETPAADNVNAIASLPSGDVILLGEIGRRDLFDVQLFPGHSSGTVLPSQVGEEIFILRLDLDSSGGFSIPWLYTFGGVSATTGTHQISIGSGSEVYITGGIGPDPLDAAGTTYLPTPYNGTFGSFGLSSGVGSLHAYLARIDPLTGIPQWHGGTNKGSFTGVLFYRPRIAAARDGVIFTQNTSSTLLNRMGDGWFSYSQSVHAKWDTNGNPVWARRDTVSHRAVTVIDTEGCAITTGRVLAGEYLDVNLPTQIRVPGPSNFNGLLARYDVAPATSLEVPSAMTPACDPGLFGATVNFLVHVDGADPTSVLEVVNTSTGDLLLTVSPPNGTHGVGPLFVPLGVTTITASLLDTTGTALLEESFPITVEDRDPPTLDGCVAQTIECAGEETLLLYPVLGVTASDGCDPSPSLTFTPAAVPMGTTSVTATARDASGNATSCTFDVTVEDTTPPHFTVVPEDIERECTDGVEPVIVFDVQARDACSSVSLFSQDETGRVVDPAGTSFGLGVHTVTCTATDPSGNIATTSFLVTVVDNTAPVLVAPADMLLPNDPGTCDAVAVFAATAMDDCDPNVAIAYATADGTAVASGDVFPLGTTIVTCTAQDTSGNLATAEFSITVFDAEAPTFGGNAGGSATLMTDCAGSALTLAFADLGVTVADNCDPSPGVSFTPSTLSPGTTWVLVTATDAAGNEATTNVAVTLLKGAFDVGLQRPLDPNVDNEIKPGRVIPLKLRLACDNIEVTDATVTIDAIELLNASGTPIVNVTVDDPGLSMDNGNVFRLVGSEYHFNLSTSGWDDTSGVRHRIRVRATRPGHVDTLFEAILINR